jgi:hypothetical protein
MMKTFCAKVRRDIQYAERPLHVGIGYRSLTLAARLGAVRNWRFFITIGGPKEADRGVSRGPGGPPHKREAHGHSVAVVAPFRAARASES